MTLWCLNWPSDVAAEAGLGTIAETDQSSRAGGATPTTAPPTAPPTAASADAGRPDNGPPPRSSKSVRFAHNINSAPGTRSATGADATTDGATSVAKTSEDPGSMSATAGTTVVGGKLIA